MSLTMLAVVVAAGAAAVLGGLLPFWKRPTTLVSSLALGFAAGVMIATVTLEVLPEALHLAALWVVAGGFALGFGTVYGLELFLYRGRVAGERAEQRRQVETAYKRKRPRGSRTTVLAGGSIFEAAIEGVSLGVAATIGSGLTLPLAVAVAIDNLSEGLSLAAFPEGEQEGSEQEGPGERHVGRWTSGIGAMTIGAALLGWFLLRNLSPAIHAAVFAAGGGGMLYLTITELVPEAEAEHYQQSSALATAVGFLVVLVLSEIG